LRLQKLADSYHSPMDDRVSDDGIQMLFHSFDSTAAPHVYADFQRAFLKNRLGPRLRQDLREWKASIEHRKVRPRVERPEMHGRDRSTA
jgi:hypothetical protein